MQINFTNIKFKNFTASTMVIEGDLAQVLSSFLTDNTQVDNVQVPSPETVVKTQETVAIESHTQESFNKELQPLSNEDLVKIIDDSIEPSFDTTIWEQYKNAVLRPLLVQLTSSLKSDGKPKSKAQIKNEAADKADLTKCMNISLSPKYDADFIELVYKARVKKYGAVPSAFVIDEFSELEPHGKALYEDLEPVEKPENKTESCQPIYILAENASLVANSQMYTVITDVLSVPKTSLYCDENGEIGEISYAQLEARHSKPKPVFVPPTDTEFENKMQAIRDNPDYSEEERANRLRNTQAKHDYLSKA